MTPPSDRPENGNGWRLPTPVKVVRELGSFGALLIVVGAGLYWVPSIVEAKLDALSANMRHDFVNELARALSESKTNQNRARECSNTPEPVPIRRPILPMSIATIARVDVRTEQSRGFDIRFDSAVTP